MRKILLLFSIVFITHFASAQYSETFSDGDFTTNPTWTGDAASFKVNTAFQLQLNASGDATASLAVPIVSSIEMEWNCWVKLSFAPSDNNLGRIYLASNQADLKSALNGYYIKLGETGSFDAIELYKQSGTVSTLICRGADGLLAAPFAIRIKVIRTTGGSWKVYADPLGGINYQLQASGTDNTFSTGSYSGVYCKFTSSNSTKFYFDDFYAGPINIDKTPPQVLSVSLAASNQLTVSFSEPVEKVSASTVNNYISNPGAVVPVSAKPDISDPSVIHLAYTQSFTSDVPYTLTVENVKDPAGNIMTKAQFPFAWHQAKTFDILINEIMADPTPTVGLPDAEYVELFNRSAFPVNLEYWSLWLGSSEKPLPKYTIPAGGFVILCDDGVKSLLEPYGYVIDFSSFAVTNTAGAITLKDYDGKMIHSVSYIEDWFHGSYKKDGGWSLEMIDPTNPCGEASNWIASTNNSGGTPGKVNSVFAPNPDRVPPAISRVGVIDPTHLRVWFSESCDSTNMSKTSNYSIDNGIGNPLSVTAVSPDYRIANLTLSTPLVSGIVYKLTSTSNITDCAGNALLTGTSARFAIPLVAEANDLVINELLFDPATGCVDFVEVFNRTTKVIDLRDLVLANYDTIGQAITDYNEISRQPFLILPNDYVVLSTDSTVVKKFYRTSNPQGFINLVTFPSMNNDFGLVAITSKSGKIIDLVPYTAEMQYPLLTSMDGVSLERISPERPSKDKTNWHSASEAVGYATPGYKNSQFGITLTGENEITLSPDIFSPDNDGYNDNLSINYTFGSPGNNASITIYDASGRLVRNLVRNELCGTSGTFSWDGITNDRRKASIGRYIVFVEIFDMNGNVKRYKKGAILGGKL